jgi:pimeloyl-ACP methyl ester carboxylesterase
MATAYLSRDAGADIQPPSHLLALTELPRAFAEFASLPLAAPLLARAPKGDGHPVLVLPGFITTDASTVVLRGFLKRLGYDAHEWGLGRNLGPRAIGREGEKLIAKLTAIHEATGQKVSLVGWSLGGVMARLVAQRLPDAVRQVITLGSPFTGSPRATNVWRTYEWMTGQRVTDEHTRGQIAESARPLAMPATSIYSKSDGIVAWQNCVEPASATADAIEVRGSHCGLGVNPAVIYAVADRLAQPEEDWQPFERTGMKRWVYPAGNA